MGGGVKKMGNFNFKNTYFFDNKGWVWFSAIGMYK
jgi:hypothetical protein